MAPRRPGIRRPLVRPVVGLVVPALVATAALAAPLGGAHAAPTEPTGPVTAPDPGWAVTDLGADRYRVAWTSPHDLPLGADRPVIVGDGLALGTPVLEDDGRTVTTVVTADAAPRVADLDVVLSGDRLDEAGFDPDPARVQRLAPRTTTPLADDPATPGTFATVTSDYELDPVKQPRMKEPIEMVGHVVEPAPDAATGPRPLVVFLHGRHSVCYDPSDPDAYDDSWPCRAPFEEIPSHLGYDYIQQILASQGYTTVSIRANGINAQDWRLDDGGADARARLVREHLDHWVGLAAEHQVDLDQVVLVGHSRGGEGVDRAALQIPAGAPYRIVGQVLVAPVDFAWHTAPYVPTVTLLPYCDGDVSDLQGQRFTDVARDLAADDPSLRSSVLVMGANHNYFNTEWTPRIAAAPSWDDWYSREGACSRKDPGRLRPAEQRDVGAAYVTGAVRLFTGADEFLPMYDGSPVTVPSAGDAEVLSHAVGGGRDLRRPGAGATPTAPAGGAESRLCRGVTSDPTVVGDCGRTSGRFVTPHWAYGGERVPTRRFLEVSWRATGARGGLRFDAPLDLSADRLELRTVVDQRRVTPEVRIRITDGTGASAELDPQPGTEPLLLPKVSRSTKLWAQTIVVDTTGAAIDLTDVTSVEVVATSRRGRLWIADVAAAPDALPPTTTDRMPTVDVGQVEVEEGGPGNHTARVPLTLDGTLTTPARVLAVIAGSTGVQRLTIDLAPGQDEASVPVSWVGDDADSEDSSVDVSIWPLRGVATDDYLGRLVITDDDEAPVITVRPVNRTVREGTPVSFEVSVAGETTRYYEVGALATTGPGSPLRGTDVPRDWLEEHAAVRRDRTLTLARLRARVYDVLEPRDARVVLAVPTVRDRLREGREWATFRIIVGDQTFVRRVAVLDAPR